MNTSLLTTFKMQGFALLIGTLTAIFTASLVSADEMYLAFWNVENLFDTEDDPNEELDEEFTPTGPKKWTEERLARKIDNLTRVIVAMNDKQGPDVLGLAEVENRKVVELLSGKMTLGSRDYKIVHQDSPSKRGIDCAIVFDSTKLTLKSSKFHKVMETEQSTRDIVEAELTTADGSRLFVFANHWPSRTHPESDRILAAKVLRRRIDEILRADADADIVALGDFNDFPDEPALKDTLGTVEKVEDAKSGKLLNASWSMFRRSEGSYVYKNKWETIDQVIVSGGLMDKRGFRMKADSVERALVVDDQLFDPVGPSIPRPNRSYSGNFYHATGYSDHLPVKLVVKYGE